ncbi:MAG: Rieske 2Fe-2S domain-containing protein [Burkholderiaceae bacterium]
MNPINSLQPDNAPPTWPAEDFSRVPYAVFSDPAIYQLEMQRLFAGPTWHYLGLEVELPKPGDYQTTLVGETSIIVIRGRDGQIRAMENSCAHRGAQLVSKPRGNHMRLTCPYHLWTYDLTGSLVGVPLEKGIKGKGGMPDSFDKSCHGLKTIRCEVFGGMVFGTYSTDVAPLQQYLGPTVCEQIMRLVGQRKPKVLGYFRQRIPGNWKLYNENVRDPYHAPLLHLFQVTFGIQTPAMKGGIRLDADGKNVWNHSINTAQDAKDVGVLEQAYEGTGKFQPKMRMADPSMVQVPLDLNDDIRTTILSVFPALILAQVDNTYTIRHLRPKGVDTVELHMTYLGFDDDDEKQTLDKLRCANMIGAAGYISMEDGEALRLVQQGIRQRASDHEVLEMGGVGEIADTDYLAQEISIRGFWRYYHQLMGFAAPGSTDAINNPDSGPLGQAR